jgi:hypothetical protein
MYTHYILTTDTTPYSDPRPPPDTTPCSNPSPPPDTTPCSNPSPPPDTTPCSETSPPPNSPPPFSVISKVYPALNSDITRYSIESVIIDTSITLCLESTASYYQLYVETKSMVKNKHIKTTKKLPPMLIL